MQETRQRRYEALDEIPRALKFVQEQINKANAEARNGRLPKGPIIAAGEKAHKMLTGLTNSPPLWLALQRQVLVHGWSFNDLEQLSELDLAKGPLVDVLTELRFPRQDDRECVEDAMSETVEKAWRSFREVRAQAVRAMTDSGILLADGSRSIRVASDRMRDCMLVDETHSKINSLRNELAIMVDRASNKDLNQAQLRWLLGLCVAAVGAAASITTVAVQITEVWNELVGAAAYLVQVLGDMRDALSSNIALLGMVIAVRQTDVTLDTAADDITHPAGEPSETSPTDDLSPTATQDPSKAFRDRFEAASQPHEETPYGQASKITRGALRRIDPERTVDRQRDIPL
jgi:hypothetical protein